ncbi:glycosyltransferase family 9 protein [Horticoccus luteus]|uniref:Glycosyltransferase family 9 protein n=1 Tax=Horticoccus luteus TaxID=2862869 RepID=A0A8F9TTH8_9BACT|nr:glycosyltransferase family 9 protein [Horticoccus luteus]QYM77840.1 glycosyltransferase family 9 protein [Horticoccus luteus]
MTADAPRILVIRRRYLGDIVLLGSLFKNLRRHWPAARIACLTETAYAPILGLNPDVNGAVTLPVTLTAWLRFLRVIRAARFTHVIDVDNTERTALVTRFTGAPVRVTYDRETNRVRARRAYTHFARVTEAFYQSHHITDTYLALLAPLGVPVATHDVALTPHAEDIAFAQRLLGVRPPGAPRRVLIHPGSRSPYRIWPAERFAAVSDRAQDELGVQVYALAGPGEASVVKAIRAAAQMHLITLDQRLTVRQFAALLTQFDLLLCHDSGPMHVAAAVGTPVVALFSSQNTTLWRPLGAQHTVLQTPLPCTCFAPGDAPGPCQPGNSYLSYCVRKLSIAEVYAAVRDRLAASPARPSPS